MGKGSNASKNNRAREDAAKRAAAMASNAGGGAAGLSARKADASVFAAAAVERERLKAEKEARIAERKAKEEVEARRIAKAQAALQKGPVPIAK